MHGWFLSEIPRRASVHWLIWCVCKFMILKDKLAKKSHLKWMVGSWKSVLSILGWPIFRGFSLLFPRGPGNARCRLLVDAFAKSAEALPVPLPGGGVEMKETPVL